MIKYHKCGILTRITFRECDHDHWDFFRYFWFLVLITTVTLIVVPIAYDSHIGYEAGLVFVQNADCYDLREHLALEKTSGLIYLKVEQKFKWLCNDNMIMELEP